MSANPLFADASRIVEEWLDKADPTQVARVAASGQSRRPKIWMLRMGDPVLSGKTVRLVLSRDFPASVARIEVDKDFCLVLPHVEEQGRVCLGVDPSPGDYADPVRAVMVVLQRFKDLVERWQDPAWIEQEFQTERLSYWLHYCDKVRPSRKAQRSVKVTYLSLPAFDSWREGDAAFYEREGTTVLCSGQDANVLARRHNLANGTLVRGHTLFVAIDEAEPWTPSTWPQSLLELDALIERTTAGAASVIKWAESKSDKRRPAPFFVVIAQGTAVYAYQLTPPLVPALKMPGIAPLWITRIDPSWSLARDQQVIAFANRQGKRIILLGCGSLGSAVAELLARGGVGSMDMVDGDVFNTENTSRHVLGMASAGRSKAKALEERLLLQIPGTKVNGHHATAIPWLVEQAKYGAYDLVVDCTGEASIRAFLSSCRRERLGQIPLVHAWMEPHGAAAHVITLMPADQWPVSDPVDTAVNAARWPETERIKLPACSDGFHPYGVADAWQAAGLAAEHVLNTLDNGCAASSISSRVRSRRFFAQHGVGHLVNSWVPDDVVGRDDATVTRDFRSTIVAKE